MDSRRKPTKGIKIFIIAVITLLVIAAALYFVIKHFFKVKEINITGSDKYTYDELYRYIFEQRDDSNTIMFKYTDSKADKLDIPFIAKTEIKIQWPDTINVTVYEKSIVGYVVYKGSNMYFDKDGIIVESSAEVFEDIPLITGLKYSRIVINEKLDIDNQSLFDAICDVTQYITKYGITVDSVNIEDDDSISVNIGEVKVLLGDNDNLMADKIYELSCMTEELEGLKGVLHLETFDGTGQNIIFKEAE